jgi:hypothetical protein
MAPCDFGESNRSTYALRWVVIALVGNDDICQSCQTRIYLHSPYLEPYSGDIYPRFTPSSRVRLSEEPFNYLAFDSICCDKTVMGVVAQLFHFRTDIMYNSLLVG